MVRGCDGTSMSSQDQVQSSSVGTAGAQEGGEMGGVQAVLVSMTQMSREPHLASTCPSAEA